MNPKKLWYWPRHVKRMPVVTNRCCELVRDHLSIPRRGGGTWVYLEWHMLGVNFSKERTRILARSGRPTLSANIGVKTSVPLCAVPRHYIRGEGPLLSFKPSPHQRMTRCGTWCATIVHAYLSKGLSPVQRAAAGEEIRHTF